MVALKDYQMNFFGPARVKEVLGTVDLPGGSLLYQGVVGLPGGSLLYQGQFLYQGAVCFTRGWLDYHAYSLC